MKMQMISPAVRRVGVQAPLWRLTIPAATCARRSSRGGRMAQPAEDHPLDRRIGRSLWREPIKVTAKGLATSAFLW